MGNGYATNGMSIPEIGKEKEASIHDGRSEAYRTLVKSLVNSAVSAKPQKKYLDNHTERVVVLRKTKEAIETNGDRISLEQIKAYASRTEVVNGIPSVDILDEGDCFVIRKVSNSFQTIIIRNGMVPYPGTEYKLFLESMVKLEGESNEGGGTVTDSAPPGVGPNQYITLDTINEMCSNLYREEEKRIVVVVLARYELDKVKKIIKNHYTYWNNATGAGVDFFWLGYGIHNNPGVNDRAEEITNAIVFDDDLYQKDTEKLMRSNIYKYGDKIALLLFDCNYGELKYENNLYLDIEALAQREDDSKLKSFVSYLIKNCKEKKQIADIELELFVRRLLSSMEGINIVSIIGFVGSVLTIIGFILT